jgi:ribonuclease HI
MTLPSELEAWGGKIYVVRRGRRPGFYKSWEEYKKQVDRFSGAEFKSFKDKREAEAWWSK